MQITVNGQQREVQPSLVLSDLLQDLALATRHVAVEVNLELVPRAKHAEYELQAGDRLEIVTLAGGG